MKIPIAIGLVVACLTSSVLAKELQFAEWSNSSARFIEFRLADVKWSGALAEARIVTGFAVPVYVDRPGQAYRIKGMIVMRIADMQVPVLWSDRPAALKDAAEVARAHGADALWLGQPRPGNYLQGFAICLGK